MLSQQTRAVKTCCNSSKLLQRAYLFIDRHAYSSVSQLQPSERIQSFRTSESNPVNHNINHTGQFYTVPPEIRQQLFLYGGIPKTYEMQAKTFNETCLMVRQPALDIINCLKNQDYSKPCNRYVLYGKMGTGKSLTLAHVIHYAFNAGFLVVHVPWVGNWMRRCKEKSNSERKEGFVDLNMDAAAWLLHFKVQNANLLSTPELRLEEEIVWNKRESTAKGAPLTELIDHGINRIKFASECVVILAREIKRLAKEGKCKVVVAIDGYNAFFYPNTRIFGEKKVIIPPDRVTLTEAFLELTKFDWNNSAAVVTVDELAVAEKEHISHLPRLDHLKICSNISKKYILLMICIKCNIK